mmetsp:Transcript_93445/g.263800  ORF Transcript_93445/g.263800 Transcript_93445/m.263800 type:complete len:261 (-) Transcript_93445:6561-7343(-)
MHAGTEVDVAIDLLHDRGLAEEEGLHSAPLAHAEIFTSESFAELGPSRPRAARERGAEHCGRNQCHGVVGVWPLVGQLDRIMLRAARKDHCETVAALRQGSGDLFRVPPSACPIVFEEERPVERQPRSAFALELEGVIARCADEESACPPHSKVAGSRVPGRTEIDRCIPLHDRWPEPKEEGRGAPLPLVEVLPDEPRPEVGGAEDPPGTDCAPTHSDLALVHPLIEPPLVLGVVGIGIPTKTWRCLVAACEVPRVLTRG